MKLAKGDVVLAADCCYLQRTLDELRPAPMNKDFEASVAVLKRLQALRESGVRIFYGHDPLFWRSVPQAKAIR